MYKDNELYEINIDKLVKSFESNEQLSVEDYIDYKDEIFSIEKMKLTEGELLKAKSELKNILNKIYDKCKNLSITKTDIFRKWASSEKKIRDYSDNDIEKILKNAITFYPKEKFVNNITDIIFNDSSTTEIKNDLLKKGTTIFTLKTGEIREGYGDRFLKSLLTVLILVFSIAWYLNFTGAVIAANTMKQTIALLLLQNLPFHAGLQTNRLLSSGSTKYVSGTMAEAGHISKMNKYFKLKWSNNISAVLNVLSDNITSPILEMKVYPKFKIK